VCGNGKLTQFNINNNRSATGICIQALKTWESHSIEDELAKNRPIRSDPSDPSARPTVGMGPGPMGPTGSVKTNKRISEYHNTYNIYTNTYKMNTNTNTSSILKIVYSDRFEVFNIWKSKSCHRDIYLVVPVACVKSDPCLCLIIGGCNGVI
jgi:hypothetical protein